MIDRKIAILLLTVDVLRVRLVVDIAAHRQVTGA